MSENKITAKCECGNKVPVYIPDHLSTIARPVDDRKNAALMGMAKCKACGKDVWIYSYIEMHEAQ